MTQAQFNEIVEQVQELTHDQRLQLRKEIEHCSDLKEVCDLLESRIEDKPQFPHCQSNNFIKHGLRNNLTRYRCKSCSKTFNALLLADIQHRGFSELLFFSFCPKLRKRTQARQYYKAKSSSSSYGLLFRLSLLPTPPHDNAVWFDYNIISLC
ncbi:hypothetical protein PQO03_08400 [Lentisphaera profundi]|uniref:Transposase zinc-ribbon domain-containing protein n=1 Tax=Lentisphaera profundi TaxID=1658616 RepID=A0ABY7VNM5_9BACT|nr:hypothetical protein [Lentisphaera profundi]WDE95735.1 hypothetical protein PQO03_08400 [Lentisphaera profundi]